MHKFDWWRTSSTNFNHLLLGSASHIYVPWLLKFKSSQYEDATHCQLMWHSEFHVGPFHFSGGANWQQSQKFSNLHIMAICNKFWLVQIVDWCSSSTTSFISWWLVSLAGKFDWLLCMKFCCTWNDIKFWLMSTNHQSQYRQLVPLQHQSIDTGNYFDATSISIIDRKREILLCKV